MVWDYAINQLDMFYYNDSGNQHTVGVQLNNQHKTSSMIIHNIPKHETHFSLAGIDKKFCWFGRKIPLRLPVRLIYSDGSFTKTKFKKINTKKYDFIVNYQGGSEYEHVLPQPEPQVPIEPHHANKEPTSHKEVDETGMAHMDKTKTMLNHTQPKLKVRQRARTYFEHAQAITEEIRLNICNVQGYPCDATYQLGVAKGIEIAKKYNWQRFTQSERTEIIRKSAAAANVPDATDDQIRNMFKITAKWIKKQNEFTTTGNAGNLNGINGKVAVSLPTKKAGKA
ncbi:hypothetical protein 1 [Beihai tombus-like virus 9]|uniref:hypothetical protein 1 n=1 Tax=Beihai tombus-like virus 9 TaxID=1922730 RepID=UPI00090C590B|nr:hypothetical protein 1 [Beihai tombus-like virus 9]APG76190.1 hypothetical protein 1 [Beihai tombus-like virus 9]